MSTVIDFEIGQKVMVPMRGMCRVEDVREETMLGQTLRFVHLKPSRGKGLIKMPASQLEGQGVRPLVDKAEVLAVLESDEEVDDLSEVESYERLDRWTEMMRSGDYGTRIQVLRQISLVAKNGALDEQEKRFQKHVRLAARREIENVLNTSAAGAGRKLNLAIKE
jgi:RNA polymerase-interacting CarD/CdnL/TRCF family regulator